MSLDKVKILQIASLAVAILAFGLGVDAHFHSIWKDFLRMPEFALICKIDNSCPHETKMMEKGFLGLTLLAIILSILGFFVHLYKTKIISLISVILMLTAGILMITSATQIDNFCSRVVVTHPDLTLEGLRNSFKYSHKLAAGIISLLDVGVFAGLFYLLHSSSPKFKSLAINAKKIHLKNGRDEVDEIQSDSD